MHFSVITLFPELVASVVSSGVIRRAHEAKHIQLDLINPRDFTTDRHRTVDDRPFGGGPGMVMKADCLIPAIQDTRQNHKRHSSADDVKVIYLSPQGTQFDQSKALELSEESGLVFVCGRYEGVDERVLEQHIDCEYSIGDFVLSGGELGAMVMIDAITRLLPHVLGHQESAEQDSFMQGVLDHPHYTRSELLSDASVPDVLKSGNHQAIAQWRRMQSLGRTQQRRPDLFEALELSKQDKKLLKQYLNEST